jgi:hypothetical protein
LVDVHSGIKRSYYNPDVVDIAIKKRAADDHVKPSDVVVRAQRIFEVKMMQVKRKPILLVGAPSFGKTHKLSHGVYPRTNLKKVYVENQST